jgi:tRNA G46 methylase TrmB
MKIYQQFAFDPARPIDDQFGRKSDRYLEIGFGGGEHLAGLAAAMPDCDFIGAEPFINGVASLLRHIHEQQLGNIRIWPDDVRLIMPSLGNGKPCWCLYHVSRSMAEKTPCGAAHSANLRFLTSLR